MSKLKRNAILSVFVVLGAHAGIRGARAESTDVKPTRMVARTHFVRVTRHEDIVTFDDCTYISPAEICGNPRPLGKNRYYTVEQLRSQRTIENWQFVGSIAADAGVVILSVLGVSEGASVIAGATYASDYVGLVGAAVGLPGGALVGGTIDVAVSALNPATQYRQSRALSEDVILDKDVTTKNITKFIKRLELVLDKI